MMDLRPALWFALGAFSLPAFAQDRDTGESLPDEPEESLPDEEASEPEESLPDQAVEPEESLPGEEADESGESPAEPGVAPPSEGEPGSAEEGPSSAPKKRSKAAPQEAPPPAEPAPAAPEEGTAEEASAGEVEPEPEPRPPRTGPGFFAGLHFGPAFALSPLSTSVLPRLEVGVELPWAQRRIRPFFTVAHSRPVHEGTADDDRVEGGTWSHDLRQAEWTFALGGWVALLEPATATVVPEVGIAPEIFLQRSRINGEAGGADFPESTEYYVKGGVLLAAGARYPLGPGEVAAHLTWHTSKLDGIVTGDSTAMQLMLTVGYRFVF